MTLEGETIKELLHDPYIYLDPDWSPDGQKVAFSAWPDTSFTATRICIYDLATDQIVCINEDMGFHPSWSPDGDYLVYSKYDPWLDADRSGFLYIVDIHTLEERQITFDDY